MLKILPLCERKSLYPIAAYWSYTSWYMDREIPFNAVLNEYKKRAAMEQMPYSFIALWGDVPAGMVSVKEKDLAGRPGLGPWLSALYVDPFFRNRGIGEKLAEKVLENCSGRGHRRIFLFIDYRNIEYLEKYYRKRGWIFLEDSRDGDGRDTKIFFHET